MWRHFNRVRKKYTPNERSHCSSSSQGLTSFWMKFHLSGECILVGFTGIWLNSLSNRRSDVSGLFLSFLEPLFWNKFGAFSSYPLTYYILFPKRNRPKIEVNLKGSITSYRENEFSFVCSRSVRPPSKKLSFSPERIGISAVVPRFSNLGFVIFELEIYLV